MPTQAQDRRILSKATSTLDHKVKVQTKLSSNKNREEIDSLLIIHFNRELLGNLSKTQIFLEQKLVVKPFKDLHKILKM